MTPSLPSLQPSKTLWTGSVPTLRAAGDDELMDHSPLLLYNNYITLKQLRFFGYHRFTILVDQKRNNNMLLISPAIYMSCELIIMLSGI